MVGTDQRCSIPKALQQRCQSRIHPFQTGTLTPRAFEGITGLTSKGNAGTGPTLPGSPFMPVRNVGFTHIQKHKNRLILRCFRQFLLDPGQLIVQAPGISSEVKALKRCAQNGPVQLLGSNQSTAPEPIVR